MRKAMKCQAIILIGAVLMPASAFSFSPKDMRKEEKFGQWSVHCETLDDMGGVTYLDCAATPLADIYIRLVDGKGVLIVPEDARLDGLEVTGCDYGLCSEALDADRLVSIFEAGVSINGITLDADGLSEAFAAMERALR